MEKDINENKSIGTTKIGIDSTKEFAQETYVCVSNKIAPTIPYENAAHATVIKAIKEEKGAHISTGKKPKFLPL
jgi:hypothetical protein